VIEKIIPRLILCNIMTEKFDDALFFLMRFVYNIDNEFKLLEGCKNFKIFFEDKILAKKLNSMKVNYPKF